MAVSVMQGSELLAKAIRERRLALELTVEAVVAKAGVGSKSWSRYEGGSSICKDKVRGVCKALNWRTLPGEELADALAEVEGYRKHEAWFQYLCDRFGMGAAVSFAAGSDILESMDIAEDSDWDDWMFDLFDDMDIVTFLYDNRCLIPSDTYHFDRWMEEQFYCDQQR